MSQESPEHQKSNRVRGHSILIALIGAVAVIAAATIPIVFAHGGSGRGIPQPPLSSPTQADQPVKPTSQTPTFLSPSAEPVSNWTPFGTGVDGFAFQKNGNNLVANTPSSYYKRMLGEGYAKRSLKK